MTAAAELYARMRNSRDGLVISVDGEPLDDVDTSELSAPTLLIAPVRDALKKITHDGLVEGHVDRDTVWQVVAYYLDDRTSHQLASEKVAVGQIHGRVAELAGWEARLIDDVS